MVQTVQMLCQRFSKQAHLASQFYSNTYYYYNTGIKSSRTRESMIEKFQVSSNLFQVFCSTVEVVLFGKIRLKYIN